MRIVSDAVADPRDDRAWPEGSFTVSIVVGLGALAGSAALVADARSFGRALDLLLVFGVLACLEAVAYLDAVAPWLRGRPIPRRTIAAQATIAVLVLATFLGGGDLGLAGLCGFLVGGLLPNASSIRYARVNRALAASDETPISEDPADQLDPTLQATSAGPGRQVRARALPKVGPVLREKLTEDRDRALAWAVATVAVLVVLLAAGHSGPELLLVLVLGLVAIAWVVRRMVGVWITASDFDSAAHVPRRAYVVLLPDRNPRLRRPLLGVWTTDPRPEDGRLPAAEAVYRCDARRVALISSPGTTVVHEAWLDAGLRDQAMPRWVAADAGVALPRRPAFLGRWYLSSLIATDRPARPRALTMPAPNATTESETGIVTTVISEESRGSGRWTRLFLGRLGGLALLAGLLLWAGR
jgi:hypothetical protein